MGGKQYGKTDKGRAEIATRQHGMATRLRPLLLMIDGKRSLATLEHSFGPHTAENIALLLAQGHIEVLAAPLVRVVPTVRAQRPLPPPSAPSAPPAAVPTTAPSAPPPAPVSMHDIYGARRR